MRGMEWGVRRLRWLVSQHSRNVPCWLASNVYEGISQPVIDSYRLTDAQVALPRKTPAC
jgi:hypothetical protein